ncbi:hypothetical protein CRE_24201 [Caenorhabditis remanei]|uniref:Uncharacterized protein n=1 Tax=Caenorhabditis remanei TaxID=31234 RepID=E3N9A0_CAERE|nr:hypothetical protein CRE_24201 [Caenorhabditis remanei]
MTFSIYHGPPILPWASDSATGLLFFYGPPILPWASDFFMGLRFWNRANFYIAIEINEDGVLTRSSGADSGVSVSGGNGTPTTTTSLDKRLVATPGCRRPMSMCERMLVERAREGFSNQRRPPISV